MTLFDALLLGAVQGITEFLPISSSGHLVIAQTFLGYETPPILFDVLVHAATLTAVIIFFFKDLLNLNKKTVKLLVVASIPTGFVGLLVHNYIEVLFSSLWVVAIGLAFTSLQLFSINWWSRKHILTNGMTMLDALIIGIFQAFAILPGVSRSGSTVSAGLRLGINKIDAFRFSFLLSIPAVLGAAMLEVSKTSLQDMLWIEYSAGFIAALTTGIAALNVLQWVIVSSKLRYFAWYCLIVSLLLAVRLISS